MKGSHTHVHVSIIHVCFVVFVSFDIAGWKEAHDVLTEAFLITQYSVKSNDKLFGRLGEKFQKLIFVKYFVSCFFERKMSEKATENGVKESDVSEPFILPSNRQPTNEVLEGIN